nr:hypothetical protein [Tanacetum cinerariifolium]
MKRQLLDGNDNDNNPVSALAAKINDMERQLLDVKLVLVDKNGVLFKPISVNQSIVMEHFPSVSKTFGTLNSPIKDVLIVYNVVSEDYANMINDNATKPKFHFRTLESGVPNEADFDVKVPIASVEERCSSYAREMVEIDSCKELIDTLVVVVPKLNDIGYMCETIHTEYE